MIQMEGDAQSQTDPGKQPRRASTVILVRHGEGALLVYLTQRSLESGFMPGNFVFPGGTVEPEDGDSILLAGHMDLDMEEASGRLGGDDVSTQDILAHGVAAIRETFEESGALLARQGGEDKEGYPPISHPQRLPSLGSGSFRDLIIKGGWVLEISRLFRWAHWITPTALPKRYDTRFFLTVLREEEQCKPHDQETTQGMWLTPLEALRRNDRGEIALSPPTLVNLHELLPFEDMRSLLAGLGERTWGKARLPKMIPIHKGMLALQTWDPSYETGLPEAELARDPQTLRPGEPFSRVWYYGGLWRPVR
jgi:8-oxo-dGTP pyrophosphatase MutT (NUDIX family)